MRSHRRSSHFERRVITVVPRRDRCARAAGLDILSGASSRSSLVAIDALAPLVPLLRLDRQRGDGTCLQALERDRLAGLLAIAVGAVVQPVERRIDFGDQLALAVARAQLDRPVGLGGRAVGKIGMIFVLGLEVGQRLLGLVQYLLLSYEQL